MITRTKKELIVQELKSNLVKYSNIIFFDSTKLENETVFNLKQELKNIDESLVYKMYKNRLINKSSDVFKDEKINEQTNLIFCLREGIYKNDDKFYEILNFLGNFIKKNTNDSFEKRVKKCLSNNVLINSDNLLLKSKIPNRKNLIINLIFILEIQIRKLIYILDNIKK